MAPTHVLVAENDDVGPSSCVVDVTGPPALSAGPTAGTCCCPATRLSDYSLNVVETYTAILINMTFVVRLMSAINISKALRYDTC